MPRPYEDGDLQMTNLSSFDLDTVPAEFRQLALDRVRLEIKVGGFQRVSKLLYGLYGAMGQDVWDQCPFVLVLGSYIKKINPTGYTPYFETTRGTVFELPDSEGNVESIPIKDSMAPKKVSILTRSILDWWTNAYGPAIPGGPNMPAIGELVAMYIVADPYRRWSAVKDIRGMGAFQMFCTPKRGAFARWSEVKDRDGQSSTYGIGDRHIDVADIADDEMYKEWMSEAWLEMRDEYQKDALMSRLMPLWDAYNWLITADLTDENLRAATWLRGPESVVGFISGDGTLAAEAQIQAVEMSRTRVPPHETYEVMPGEYANVPCHNAECWDCRLQGLWARAIEDGSTAYPPTTHAWKSGLLQAMTSKSSGMPPMKVEGTYRGKKIEVSTNKKITAFLLDPNGLIAGASLVQACQASAQLTNRSDIARKTRMVVLNAATKFAWEQAWGKLVEQWTMKSDDGREMSFAMTTGVFFADVGPAVVATTSGSDTDIIVCWDMTAMDTHSRPQNVLNNRKAGILAGLKRIALDPTFGDFGPDEEGNSGLMRAVKMVYNSYMDGQFIMKNSATGQSTAFSNRALLSGELLTTITHGMTNICLLRLFLDIFNRMFPQASGMLGAPAEKKWVSFTGDDAITVVQALWNET